jgi:hypothetical protein
LKALPAIPGEGLRLPLGSSRAARFQPVAPRPEPVAGELEVVVTDRTFGTEELSGYSACLLPLQERPFAGLHPRDAAEWGLRDGDRVALRTGSGTAELTLRCFEAMAPGTIVIPHLRATALPSSGSRLRRQDLRKA